MGKAPSRSVSLPKLERKVQEGLALSHGEMKFMRRATALADAKPSPNATNYGLTERVAKERAIAGTDRMDAALGRGTTTGTDKMLAFVYDRVENTGFGGHTSAGQVYSQTPFSLAGLKAAPRLEANSIAGTRTSSRYRPTRRPTLAGSVRIGTATTMLPAACSMAHQRDPRRRRRSSGSAS